MSYFGYYDDNGFDYYEPVRERTPRKTAAHEDNKTLEQLSSVEARRRESEFRQHGRVECRASTKTRHLRQILLGDGNGSQARRHLGSDQELTQEDEFYSRGLIESARSSLTCQELSSEDLEEQAEEYIHILQEEAERRENK